MAATPLTAQEAVQPHLNPSDLDVVTLTQELIQCRSITPIEGGALDVLEKWLKPLGFKCTRLPFEEEGHAQVDNLFAFFQHPDATRPHLCFAGHTDVVPTGAEDRWHAAPFEGKIENGFLIGRGAVDMKGGIAAYVAALKHIYQETGSFPMTLSLLITGDEEDVAINGTRKVLKWMQDQGHQPDFCLVGEPTSLHELGDTIKIGRRGSLNTHLTLKGKQGHVAFPHQSDNPIPRLLNVLTLLNPGPLEPKSDVFEPTNLEITSIDVGNRTTNLIPQEISARFNIRFNNHHSGKSLAKWIETTVQDVTQDYDISFEFSGDADLCEDERWTAPLEKAIRDVTGLDAGKSTAGATSDARFIKTLCPVVEFGLKNETMHQINECVELKDLIQLTSIYHQYILNIGSQYIQR